MGELSKKVQESRVKWYGHVLRREEYVGKRVVVMEVPGKIWRSRPKRRWLDNIKNDLSERELLGEEAQDRVKWRRLIRHIDPTQCGKGDGMLLVFDVVLPKSHAEM